MRDYYEILNVSKDSSQDEIKSSFRKLAKKYHPDLNPDNKESEQRFKEINEAYEVLGDPEKRRRYDTYGHAGVNGQGGYSQDFGGFDDIFDDIFDIFGGGFGRNSSKARRQGPVKGANLRYNLNLEFKEAVFGVEKEIKIRKSEPCKTCDGTGVKPGSSKETCNKCNGTGELRYTQQTPFGKFVRTATCDKCNGTGEIIKEKCTTCSGTGKETKNKKIKVKVPAGVDTGSIISIRGEGEAGERGGPSGDLYVYINVKEHSIFKRDGNDIYYTIPISFVEAALGTEIDIPTLEGTTKYTIPEGTQTGTQFRLKNMGVPNVRGIGRGDLYFKIKVEVPERLTERQKELLIEFAKESGEDITKSKKGFFSKMKDAFGN
ncbi:molecular chaperone DnaJ [Schnuerera sp. xch1]|uniref:molecular chaperone DnaJ n=1 Tax=Schnuerera sp. xch1 TaxID=2874283 RepID=UPI001CBB12A7|nr:molecular chaperone DnaJ [Schnuerera sp. xch1]MBZ2175741.1 molecular chaperone DnaJ [Schnuerera sp. xch1]